MNAQNTSFEAPYPGLRAFRTVESPVFCGRSEHRLDLLQKLESNRFLAVVGASGSGKSSLVKAGLLADIRSGLLLPVPPKQCRIVDFRPGLNPFRSMAATLAEILELPISEVERLLRSGSGGLVRVLDSATHKYAGSDEEESGPGPEPPILVAYVDQFEELFRFAGLEEHEIENSEFQKERAGFPLLDGVLNEAQAFVSMLLESSEQKHYRVYVVLSMRSDFLKDVDVYERLPEAISNSQFLTPLLNRDQMEEAIERPLKRFRARADERLVPLILNQAAPEEDQLPVLQHALARTWDHASAHWNGEENRERVLTIEDFRAVGSLAKALENHADEVMGSLTTGPGATLNEREVARFFTCLAEFDAHGRLTRRPRTVRQIATESGLDEGAVRTIADAYRAPGCHLIMPPVEDVETLDPEDVLDISHESLLRKWPRLLGWMERERERAAVFRQVGGIIRENEWTVPESRWDAIKRAARSFFKGSPIAGWQRRRAARVLLNDGDFTFTDEWAKRHDGDRGSATGLITQAKFENSVRMGTFLAAVLIVGSVLLVSEVRRQGAEEKRRNAEQAKALAQADLEKKQAEAAADRQRLERELAQEKENSARIAEVATAGGSQQGQKQWQEFIGEIAKLDGGKNVLSEDDLKPLAVNLGLDLSGFKAAPTTIPIRAGLQAPRIDSFEVPTLGAEDLYFLDWPEPSLLIKTQVNRGGKPELFHVWRDEKAALEKWKDAEGAKGGPARVFSDASYVAVSPNGDEAVLVENSGLSYGIVSAPEGGPPERQSLVGPRKVGKGLVENEKEFLGVRWLDEQRLLFVHDAGFRVVDKESGGVINSALFDLPGAKAGAESMVWMPARQWLLVAPGNFLRCPIFEISEEKFRKVGEVTFGMSNSLQRFLVSPAMTSVVATTDRKGVEQASVWNFANIEEAIKGKGGASPLSMPVDLPPDNWMGYSPDGAWFVVSDSKGVLHAWSEQDLRVGVRGTLRPPTLQLLGHNGPVTAAAWGEREDGSTICATGDRGGSVLLWRFPDPGEEPQARVREVSGLRLIDSLAVREPEPRRDIEPIVLPSHKGGVTALALSRDGRTLASAGQDGGKFYPIESSIVGGFRKFEKLDRSLAIPIKPLDTRFADLFAGKQGAEQLADDAIFLAARWDYALTPRTFLRDHKVRVYKLNADGTRDENTKSVLAQPVDWGPAEIDQGSRKIVEISDGLVQRLGLDDDDLIEVEIDLLAAATPTPTTATVESIKGEVFVEVPGAPKRGVRVGERFRMEASFSTGPNSQILIKIAHGIESREWRIVPESKVRFLPDDWRRQLTSPIRGRFRIESAGSSAAVEG